MDHGAVRDFGRADPDAMFKNPADATGKNDNSHGHGHDDDKDHGKDDKDKDKH